MIQFDRLRESFKKRIEIIQKKKKIGGLATLFRTFESESIKNILSFSQDKSIISVKLYDNESINLSNMNIVDDQSGESLIENLKNLLKIADSIHYNLYEILTYIRFKAPRLFLFSDESIMEILTSNASPTVIYQIFINFLIAEFRILSIKY